MLLVFPHFMRPGDTWAGAERLISPARASSIALVEAKLIVASAPKSSQPWGSACPMLFSFLAVSVCAKAGPSWAVSNRSLIGGGHSTDLSWRL